MRCLKCHRPMIHPGKDGLGPKCAKTAKPIPSGDLFYSAEQVSAEIASRHLAEMRDAVAAARRRCGVAA